MARPGPTPKPTALKLLQGNPGKRRVRRREPKPKPAPGVAPPALLRGEALEEWKRLTPELARLGLLTELDRAALTAYCQLWHRFIEAERVIAKKGMTYTTPNGALCQRPEVSIARNSATQLRLFAAEFGFTPAARTRVSATPPEDDSEKKAKAAGVA